MATSAGAASSSGGGEGGTSVCPICLERVHQEAFLDRCFHSFCYHCIVKWHNYLGSRSSQPLSSIRCPLCKCESISIIHGFSGGMFQRHYVNQESENRCLSDVHVFRMLFYTSQVGLTKSIFDVQQYWKRYKYLQKNVWLQNWLRREIQTLTQDENADIIVHHINGVAESFFRRQPKGGKGRPEEKREEFRLLLTEAARPFLTGRTDQFIDELELFLASGLTIEAYDKVCMQHLSLPKVGEADNNKNEMCDQALQGRYSHFLNETDELD